MRFLLVDRILRIVPGAEAVVLKNVSNSEDFFADHFPGRPIMPGCLILEACDQTARLLLASSAGFRSLPKLEQVINAKFRHFVQPGDSLQVHVAMRPAAEGEAEVRATAAVGDRTVVQATLIYRLVKSSGDPAAARALDRMRAFWEVLTNDPLGPSGQEDAQVGGPPHGDSHHA